MREKNCRGWRSTLGFTGGFMVDCKGKSGGLALFWKDTLLVDIKSCSMGHIDAIVREGERLWRFTGFYGQPEASLRHFSWELLLRLGNIPEVRHLPWLVGGDFNEICFDSEKLGGNLRSSSHMKAFRDSLELCELQDLHCEGEFFTWANRREGNHVVFERLDRYVGNLGWRLLYPTARVISLDFFHSDHRPIWIKLSQDPMQCRARTRSQEPIFRFENCWLQNKECSDVVKYGWGCRDPSRTILDRILSCKRALMNWDKERFRKIPELLKAKRNQLSKLRQSSQWNNAFDQIRVLEANVEQLATEEEVFWRQRSRVTWLKDGDRNSRYFHSKATHRKSRNTITGLVTSHGDWCTDGEGMSNIVLEYFHNLFTSSNPSVEDLDRVLVNIEPKVNQQMNRSLCAPFVASEVRRALFDMHPDKSPGPDGMSTLFFQKFWNIVGDDVTEAVLKILNERAPLDSWNGALVTLIPKVNKPLLVKEFRPISLCNVCYKIVSRAITNRLRPILSCIIEENQSAFIPGRLIADNIIIGFEILHWMKNRRAGRSGYAALKLDMSKAYDRVEWDFLQALMGRLGFDEHWISLIMNCVRTVSYSFRVNQEVSGPIKPSRGLRQGDPLSPYLFVLCAHGLSSMLSTYESRGLFRGVKIATTSPSVSHLFFADDSLIFFRATLEEGARVKDCFTLYEKASGQLINYDKSALSFSPNTNPHLMETVKNILTISVVQCHELYLGLPTVSVHSKRLQFRYLVERVVKRIQGWGHKWFSTGGKEVLIKSILQAIPTYAMSVFKIPISVCDEIERECANFWWGMENGKKRMHWHTWDALCQPKSRGGLGFRKLGEFNRALLAKHLWRILRNPDSLVGRVLKGRYFKHRTILTANLGNNPSYIWRSLIWSRETLESGLLWRVGNGKSIKIFEDKWIPSMQSPLGTPLNPWDHTPTVSSLIRDGNWDVDLISNSFNPFVAGEILKIPLPLPEAEDVQFWRFESKGQYSVRSGCRLQRGLFNTPENHSEYHIEKWWSFLWSLSLPPKVRLFWWSVSHDAIPTNLNLARHHVPVISSCNLCGYAADSTCHALFFCVAIKHLWKMATFSHKLKAARWASTLELCFWMQENLTKEEFEKFAMLAWAIWKEKQTFLHGDRANPFAREISWSEALLDDFRLAKKREELLMGSVHEGPERIWKPPGMNGLKLNVDASINHNLHRYSVGGVIRDYQGRLLLAFGKQINQPISVVHGELLAIREGVNLVYERAFRDVEVASDSLLAVQAVTATQENLGYDGLCAKDISRRLSTPEISVVYHVSRSANNVAHTIASFASSTPSPFVWVNGDFPSWLVRLVIEDYH